MNNSSRFILFVMILLLAIAGTASLTSTIRDPLPAGTVADKLLIEKKHRRLTLYSEGKVLKVYKVALGRNPFGKRLGEG